MSKLVLNEIIKVVKKKSFIIMLIVIICFSFFVNFLYKTMDHVYEQGNNLQDYDYTKEYSDDEGDNVATAHANESFDKLVKKYKNGSWQYNYLLDDSECHSLLYDIKSYEDGLSTDKEAYQQAKDNYELIVKNMDDDDWKAIVQRKKDSYEQQLSADGENDELKLSIEELNLRLEKNISYQNSLENTNLNDYISSKGTLMTYKDIDKLSNNEKDSYYESRKSYLTSEYYLDHGDELVGYGASSSVIINFFSEYSLIIIVMILMISGSIVSNEYKTGTIKSLLTKPHTRTKILLSKYLVAISTILIACLIMLVVQLIVGGLFFGFKSLTIPVVVYSSISDSITTYNIFHYVLLNFLGNLPMYLLLATLAFGFSTITKSTSISIIIGYVGYFFGNMFSVFNESNKWWIKILFSSNWDFTPYIFKNMPTVNGLTLGFSLAVCIIYLLIILVPTFIVFKQRDISNA